MIICTKRIDFFFFYFRVLGGDGYLFQLHTGHADQNCLVEAVLISTTGSYFWLKSSTVFIIISTKCIDFLL